MNNPESTYIYLPSSTPSLGRQNTLAHFTCTLQSRLDFDPSSEWMVGLASMLYPRSALNIVSGELSFYSYTLGMVIDTRIAAGEYPTIESVVDALNAAMDPDKPSYIFSVNKTAYRLMVELHKPHGATETPEIWFSQNLQMLSGFPAEVRENGYHIANSTYNLYSNMSTMYVYTPDLIGNVCVGDRAAPLLAVCDYDGNGDFGSLARYEPRTIQFVPLSNRNIQSITVEIRNKLGDFIPFSGGSAEVLLVLAIKRAAKFH